jgi:hypothetical protein
VVNKPTRAASAVASGSGNKLPRAPTGAPRGATYDGRAAIGQVSVILPEIGDCVRYNVAGPTRWMCGHIRIRPRCVASTRTPTQLCSKQPTHLPEASRAGVVAWGCGGRVGWGGAGGRTVIVSVQGSCQKILIAGLAAQCMHVVTSVGKTVRGHVTASGTQNRAPTVAQTNPCKRNRPQARGRGAGGGGGRGGAGNNASMRKGRAKNCS